MATTAGTPDVIIVNETLKQPSYFSTHKFQILMGNLGWALALVYAFKTKSGFWKGVGYVILGSIALGGVGYGIDSFNKNKED